MCPHPPYSPALGPSEFWLFPEVKTIQDIEAATTRPLKTPVREDFQNCLIESGDDEGISVFEASGSILRGDDGDESFGVLISLYLPIHRIVRSHLVHRNQRKRRKEDHVSSLGGSRMGLEREEWRDLWDRIKVKWRTHTSFFYTGGREIVNNECLQHGDGIRPARGG